MKVYLGDDSRKCRRGVGRRGREGREASAGCEGVLMGSWGSNPLGTSGDLVAHAQNYLPVRDGERKLVSLSLKLYPALIADCWHQLNFPTLLACFYPWLSFCGGESSEAEKSRELQGRVARFSE